MLVSSLFKQGTRGRPACAWFLEIALVREVGMFACVRVCVSAPEAINYIHLIPSLDSIDSLLDSFDSLHSLGSSISFPNLYNQLNKFVAFSFLCMEVAFVTKRRCDRNQSNKAIIFY